VVLNIDHAIGSDWQLRVGMKLLQQYLVLLDKAVSDGSLIEVDHMANQLRQPLPIGIIKLANPSPERGDVHRLRFVVSERPPNAEVRRKVPQHLFGWQVGVLFG
jgi:hypothetical protein